MSARPTRKEWMRQQFEDDFYERWGGYLPNASHDELERLREKLVEVNAGYPETMLWLKTMVLTEIARRE